MLKTLEPAIKLPVLRFSLLYSHSEEFKISGEFILGDSNNGIDPVNEDINVVYSLSLTNIHKC